MSSSPPKIWVAGACERDLDLLLLEEFIASPEFVTWFAVTAGLQGEASLVEAARSVNTSNGESDLELTMILGGRRVRLLVENKVDAQLQPRQAERYRERAANYVRTAACDGCITLLVAPTSYLGGKTSSLGFDRCIALESIREWFRRSGDGNERTRYKLTLIDRTLERGASGWTLVPDVQGTTLWREYWVVAERVAPELQMPEPGPKPAGSNFVYFRPPELPKGVDLVHKMPYGRVDLQFAGMGENTAALKAAFGGVLEPGMKITRAQKSAVVRIDVPQMDCGLPFTELAHVAEVAIRAAASLVRWHAKHGARLIS